MLDRALYIGSIEGLLKPWLRFKYALVWNFKYLEKDTKIFLPILSREEHKLDLGASL